MNFDWKRKLTQYPFLILAVSCLMLLFVTRGQVDLMNPVSIGILFFAIGLVSFSKLQYGIIGGLFMGIFTGIASGYMDQSAIVSLAGLVIIVPLIIHKAVKKDLSGLIILFFILGFYMRITYVLVTDVAERQNDVGYFLENSFNPHHAGYIQYIERYGWIPNTDVRTMDQWYHPPFYHLVAGYFMRLYGLLIPHLKGNYEAIQLITLFCAETSVIAIYKIIRLFGVEGKPLVFSSLILNIFPMFILSAGGVNNDIMATMFFLLSLYMGIKWYKSQKFADIILCSVFVGLGMMTKLNCWLVAVPLGIIFLYVLSKNKFKNGKLWLQYGIFALISFPLGLWFPVRNLVKFGVPMTYILVPFYEINNVPNYTWFQRLFHFIPLYNDTYSIPAYTVYTSLFDYCYYSDLPYFGLESYFVIFVFSIIVLLSLAGLIYWIVKLIKSRKISILEYALLAMAAAQLISYVIFCFKYPFICTMSFRYITPITICFVIGYGKAFEIKSDLMKLGLKSFGILFAILSVAFYSMIWLRDIWYV